MTNKSHPLNRYASSQADPVELATMQDIYDRTISSPGVTQEEFAKILRWTVEQANIKRFEEAIQPLMEWLKRSREEEGVLANDGDFLGEQTDLVGRYIWDHWDD